MQPSSSDEYRDAFALFDTKGNGRVPKPSLGDLLRACGQNPTLAEVADLQGNVGADCTFSASPLPSGVPVFVVVSRRFVDGYADWAS
jgi:hypothetical protein